MRVYAYRTVAYSDTSSIELMFLYTNRRKMNFLYQYFFASGRVVHALFMPMEDIRHLINLLDIT